MKKINLLWPYLLILLVTSVYFIYLLNDSRYFFVDDFTGFTFAVPRTYKQVVIDSLLSRSVDRHKFIGYLITKWLYHHAGTQVSHYFLILFVIHTLNSFMVYRLLNRLTKKPLTSLLLSLFFAYRFFLSWFSNIHVMTEGLFLFIFLDLWLNYLNKQKIITFFSLGITYFLAIFSYGPAFLFAPALIPFTIFLQGWQQSKKYFKVLLPFLVFVPLYLLVFTFTKDSLTRFAETTNPYRGAFSLQGFTKVQSIYLSLLSGQFIPSSVPLTLIIYLFVFLITLKVNKKLLLLPITFFVSLAANSFFPQHTMFYYLYPPIIFLLLYFVFLFQEKYWPILLIFFLIIFNPFHQIYQVAFRLKHPSLNFEEKAMAMIISSIEEAIDNGDSRIQLSNWEVTPNLQHAIDYQAIPLFLSHPKKLDFIYSYSRDTQVLTLINSPSPTR